MGESAHATPARRSAADRFHDLTVWLRSLLPAWLQRYIPHTAIGFAMVNSTTFALDLALLSFFYTQLHLPNPVAVTLGYVIALCAAFVLNKWLNFRAEGHVGRQSARYVLTVAINYTAIILGIGSGLTTVGVPYWGARLLAGACEAVFMYTAMRWFVFANGKPEPQTAPIHLDTTTGSIDPGQDQPERRIA
ncbi:GtrA family protein [Kribbia dieselivorans]|uniref:GtrA family protein n=1 Tax=Kribbia dieselivorans TaxID=331526 RepID=UPI0009F8C8E7|nr:GtrA family protein [Kribbia dieselivorans]